jgi:hypothetical protein
MMKDKDEDRKPRKTSRKGKDLPAREPKKSKKIATPAPERGVYLDREMRNGSR